MARSFRYYGKKRGNRRTGSPVLASVGEALFFAVLLLLGCAGMVWMLSNLVVPEWRVKHEFVETTCKVLDKRIGEKLGEDGPLYRPDIKIEYEVGGITYRDWHYDVHRAYSSGRDDAQAALDQFALYDKAKNNRYSCWYDPMNPYVVVLVRGYRWWVWLLFTVPVSFMAIGAGGLIYTLLHRGKSAERRSAMALRAQERDFFGTGGGPRDYPSVPQGVDMTNSPGTRLRFRLPMATSPGWALFGTLAFCVIWNGVVWVFAAIAIGGHLAGHPDWFLTLFIVPFVSDRTGSRRLLHPAIAGGHGHRANPDGNLRSSLSARRAVPPVPLAIRTAGDQRLARVAGVRRSGHLSPRDQYPHRKPSGLSPGAFLPQRVSDRERVALGNGVRIERARGGHALLQGQP